MQDASPRQSPISEPPAAFESKRLLSLDAFRGLAVLGMLIVNNKALGPWTPAQLTHAAWGDGVHFADMVFPWFLFIVGVAIPFSVASARRQGLSNWALVEKISARAVVLVLIGVLINSSYARHFLFDIGVLQTIGFAYFFGALLYHLRAKPRAAAAGLLLVGHWAALRFVPFPGHSLHAFTQAQNLIAYLNDHYLLRLGVANLPAIAPTTALVLIGTLVGDLVRRRPEEPRAKVKWLVVAGAALVVSGELWSLSLPMVKHIWTAPYIVFAAGTGLLTFAFCYWSIDIWSRRGWAFPLVVFGMNAIAAFAVPILVNIYILDGWNWVPSHGHVTSVREHLLAVLTTHLGAGPGGLLFTVLFVLAWWLVFLQMYRRRIFLRV